MQRGGAYHSAGDAEFFMPESTMPGNAVAYLRAFHSWGTAPRSLYTRIHWQKRHTKGAAHAAVTSHDAPEHDCRTRPQSLAKHAPGTTLGLNMQSTETNVPKCTMPNIRNLHQGTILSQDSLGHETWSDVMDLTFHPLPAHGNKVQASARCYTTISGGLHTPAVI